MPTHIVDEAFAGALISLHGLLRKVVLGEGVLNGPTPELQVFCHVIQGLFANFALGELID